MIYRERQNLKERIHELELENSRLNGIIEELRRQVSPIKPITIPTSPYVPYLPNYYDGRGGSTTPAPGGWPYYQQVWC